MDWDEGPDFTEYDEYEAALAAYEEGDGAVTRPTPPRPGWLLTRSDKQGWVTTLRIDLEDVRRAAAALCPEARVARSARSTARRRQSRTRRITRRASRGSPDPSHLAISGPESAVT
jgi:hypothetical protein